MARSKWKSKQQVVRSDLAVVTPLVRRGGGAERGGNARLALGGALAIAALFALGAGLIYAETEYEPSRAPVGQRPSRQLDGAPQAATVGEAPFAEAAPVAPAVPEAPKGAIPAKFQPARRQALMATRRDLVAGFNGLREPVERCGAKDASFILALQATAGAIRVEEARVETQGAASDDAVACARSALAGRVIPAPSTIPGRRWEVSFSVPAG